ncbi:putative polysaccharide biosynthesis protein [Enterococcus caccae]|uniref:Polysaccharide biosynthesis family protein n=1 Tax=Enterococcus caccae ATCC BAA-1240 TaxID=1158612 RepID=R3WCK1_9ENTE|nr:polysaccharide biosynthesis protein [Enterococcus caccae]EOL45202.1 polysaccharide biosynthesis family protein [Enterococcus caccae ATCC BAA-1240]EOT58609.1 polysaccharide biosynthesis family protein [Enterococcus caccae ATCC BAA-1240]OJG27063.1 polysaccharide biosynthesis family protein [Enterococcus caccae]
MINQPNPADQPILTNQEKMVKGSAWMTASNIISRLLGAVYIIPWYAWMGEHANEANSLSSMGYTVYALFLLISTAGIPAAIAKQTSYYNSLNEYKISRQLFFKALQLMAILGAIFAIVMYLASPLLAKWSGGGEELIPTMRSLSLAVLIFPCMSVVRGYFQGNQDMMPYALSQIVEQVARVFYMLLTAFIIMKMLDGNYVSAVTQSTLAAFIGMLASLVVLFYYFHKQKPMFDYLAAHSANEHQASTRDLLIETLKEALPFIIVGSGVTVFKLVDQFTFSNFMNTFTAYSGSQLRTLFAIFNANPDKLTMVVIALATSISATGLPLITEAITLKKYRDLSKLISNNLQLFMFVMLPATFGMIVLAKPLYTMFYAPDDLGVSVLIQACFAGLFMGLYMLSSTMLMGMYENKAAIKYFGLGLALKLIVQYPSVRLFEVYGPLIATMIGFTLSCVLIMRKIKKVSHFNFGLTLRRGLLIFLITLVMMIGAIIMRQFLYLFLDPTRKFQSFVIIMIVATFGGAIYGYITLKLRLADKLIGARVSKIRHKLKIK